MPERDHALTTDELRMEYIATRASEKTVQNCMRLLGLNSDADITQFRDNTSYINEQRRRQTATADATRRAIIERVITGAGIVVLAGLAGFNIASKGLHG